MSERQSKQRRDTPTEQPTERWYPPREWLDVPTERLDPPTERLDPPTERLDPPTERLDPPTERLDPPTQRTEPSPALWAERPDPSSQRTEPPPIVWADPQRPPLLHTATPAGAGSPGARNARIAAFGGLAALIVLAIAIIVSNSSGGGPSKPVRQAVARHSHGDHGKAAATASARAKTTSSKHATTSSTPATSTPASSTPATSTPAASGPTTTSPAASTTAPSTPTTSGSTSAPTSTTAGPSGGTAASATTPFTNAHLSVAVPAGWSAVENDISKGSFLETKWQNQADGSTLLVDYQPASGASPQGEGAPVRRAVRKQPGYSEVGWGPGDLPGRQSWKWTFTLPSQGESVDYFFSECGTDYAVLGTAPPDRFNALAARFRAFAASVKHC